MKILSYNVNGIRSAINKGLVDFVAQGGYDIVCIQEIKALQEQVDVTGFEALGYHHYWFSAEKKGYSGTAIFSKMPAINVVKGMNHALYDGEGRVLQANFEDFTLLNCYFPSGTSGDERQGVKIEFLNDVHLHIEELRKTYPKLIVVGDYNIAHTEMDIHNPKGNKKTSGFLPEEREWLTKWFNNGFIDAFRFKNTDLIEYSWWSTRFNSRAQNKGWRIDYQSVTDNLKHNIVNCNHLTDAIHSDHCPVLLEMDFTKENI